MLVVVGSGCWGEGDGVAEGFELANVVASLAVRVDVAGEVIGTEIGEDRVLVVQEMPDNDQDGAADSDNGAFLASSSGDAPVAFTEEGARAADADCGFAEDAGEVAVAVSGGAVAFGFAGRGVDARGELRPGT